MSHPTFATIRNLSLATAAALTLASSVAFAQDYDNDRDAYRASEEVIVVAPPYRGGERSPTTGAPIRNVALSREIYVGDLDLRTRWGERALMNRIHATARTLCNKMDRMYPVSADNSPDCYRTAVNNAMDQAYDAIDRARNE
jgi:UrcA family protein